MLSEPSKPPIQLVDSHCHLDRLDLTPYDGELSKAIRAASEVGISQILCVCIDLENFKDILHIANTYPHVTASVGIHPNEKIQHAPSVDELVQLADDANVVAIGETGLDYYRSGGDLTWQHDRFRMHIQAARKAKKPLIIHSRQARDDTIRIMHEESAGDVRGVMHCFTETWEMAKQAMDCDFYISFSGIVTFKNAKEIQEVAMKVPLNRMLIETDAPYLAPVPYRGKPNEPAYVRYVAECIAELRGIPLEEVALQTTQNFFDLFPISKA